MTLTTLFGIFFVLTTMASNTQVLAHPWKEGIEEPELFPLIEKCKAKCGGDQAESEVFRSGKAICVDPYQPEKDPEKDEPMETWGGCSNFLATPCQIECLDAKSKVARNQNACNCCICYSSPRVDQRGYCSAPGVGQIKQSDDCNESVCAGKGNVKYYGAAYCNGA